MEDLPSGLGDRCRYHAQLERILRFLIIALTVLTIGCGPSSHDQTKELVESGKRTTEIANEIERTILGNYTAMESEHVSKILASYHPDTNLPSSAEQLEKYYTVAGMAYQINDYRYVGNDGTNYVAIFHEKTEFRKKTGGKKFIVVDNEDTDVLMVFRKHEGKFKIFTSRSLKPGMW